MTKNTKMTEHSRDSMSSPKRCLELVLAAMMIALCLTACSSSDTPVKEEASASDGQQIRRCAVENGVTVFTALDTARVLLDVLEEITMEVSEIE